MINRLRGRLLRIGLVGMLTVGLVATSVGPAAAYDVKDVIVYKYGGLRQQTNFTLRCGSQTHYAAVLADPLGDNVRVRTYLGTRRNRLDFQRYHWKSWSSRNTAYVGLSHGGCITVFRLTLVSAYPPGPRLIV